MATQSINLKPVRYCGQRVYLACDGNCSKAWGIQCRPKVRLSDDDDDYEWLADDELGEAPLDPETYEGRHGKPGNNQVESMNKWCARQCERSIIWDRADVPPVLPDFSKRIKNMGE